MGKWSKENRNGLLAITLPLFVLATGCAIYIYKIGGVVRDVPELNISKSNNAGNHKVYTDRVYKLEKDFTKTGKKKVLCIGHSYARDMVNVLLESKYSDSIEIRYIYTRHSFSPDEIKRIKDADIIFTLASHMNSTEKSFVLDAIRKYHGSKPLYGIGTKEYGGNNGNLYNRRFRSDYHKTRLKMVESYKESYMAEKSYWGDKYIDFMTPVLDNNGMVNPFTRDYKYISADCRHLTQSGAKFYAEILPLKDVFYKKE